MSSAKIFISATSGDLGFVRQRVKEALLAIGCHPVEQTNFPPDYRPVREMLEARIGECDAMIHIVGMRYGAEPDPASLPPDTPRLSYTQMEYRIGQELAAKRKDRFRVYTFVCPEDFPYQPAPPEDETCVALQRAHRMQIQSSERLYTPIAEIGEIDVRVREIQLAFDRLKFRLDITRRRIAIGIGALAVIGLSIAVALFTLTGRIGESNPYDAFQRQAEALGVDISAISSSDFRAEFSAADGHQISVTTDDRLAALLRETQPSINIEDSGWQTAWTAGRPGQVLHYILTGDRFQLGGTLRFQIRFQPAFSQTGETMVIGPFALDVDIPASERALASGPVGKNQAATAWQATEIIERNEQHPVNGLHAAGGGSLLRVSTAE